MDIPENIENDNIYSSNAENFMISYKLQAYLFSLFRNSAKY